MISLTTATNNALPNTQERISLIDQFPTIVDKFQNGNGNWLTKNCQHLKEEGIHYYGIHKNTQMQSGGSSEIEATHRLYQELKGQVLQIMGLPGNTQVIQVVGDSASFSHEGTSHAKDFLRTHLPHNAVILYGYTGHQEADGTRCVNAAVSDVIEERGSHNSVIGNLVGFHTPAALKGWGCTGPELKHYVIVYGDDESKRDTGTVFGDDVTTSDFFADKLLACDGGAQSFRQMCNALLLDQKIEVIAGLRSDAKAYATETVDEKKILTPYFAAAKFLDDLTVLLAANSDSIEEADLQKWYGAYFGREKCYIGDPKRPDFDTKKKLMDEAWGIMVKHKLYLKISSLTSVKKIDI